MDSFAISKFDRVNGQPDIDQIEAWVESFFNSTVSMINGFFCRLDIKEAVTGIENIPFEQMVREQLENESEEIITIAIAKIKELTDMQIEYLKAYAEQPK
jgi:hypothetical protein